MQESKLVLQAFAAAQKQLQTRVAGHQALIDRLLMAVITGGHVLIEGSPGLAKTRTVNCFAQTLASDFVRIQSTPDLMPSDLTGTNVFQQQTSTFRFEEGPLFNNIVLVDEINRAPPKVQSALLEAMAERQISAAGVTRQLSEPFMVVATQNPIEHEGTYPLPEAQLDRFMFFLNVTLPNPELESEILELVLKEAIDGNQLQALDPVLNADQIQFARAQSSRVHISEAIKAYIISLVTATRGFGDFAEIAAQIEHPASPRGTIFLAQAAQASAWLAGRDHVLPEDVTPLVSDVLSGRFVLTYEAQARGVTGRELTDTIVSKTPLV